ncbi:MAG: hypothetical protein IH625_14615 [Rhodobacteraceae bacterium]|nr:hypothetical protein [Paracoccaceae bacterium]
MAHHIGLNRHRAKLVQFPARWAHGVSPDFRQIGATSAQMQPSLTLARPGPNIANRMDWA